MRRNRQVRKDDSRQFHDSARTPHAPESTIGRWLKSIFVLAPLSYFFGRSYDVGYLTTLGVWQGLPPLSWEESVYNGIVAAISTVVHIGQAITGADLWLGFLYSLGCCAVVITALLLAKAFSKAPPEFRRKIMRPLRWLNARSRGFWLSLSPIGAYIVILLCCGFIAVITYYVVEPAYLAELCGTLDGQEMLKKLRAKDARAHFPFAVTKTEDGKATSPLVVDTRGDWYIVFDGERCRLVPKASVFEIVGASKVEHQKVESPRTDVFPLSPSERNHVPPKAAAPS